MQTFTTREARACFGKLLDCAQCKPVQVTRRGRVVGVMVSAEDYESMRVYYAQRLINALNETADAAAHADLTPEILATLLNEED